MYNLVSAEVMESSMDSNVRDAGWGPTTAV